MPCDNDSQNDNNNNNTDKNKYLNAKIYKLQNYNYTFDDK